MKLRTPSKKELYGCLYLPSISNHEIKVGVVINVCPKASIVLAKFFLCDLKINIKEQ